MRRIIKSVLDLDLYKLTMSNVYFKLFPEVDGEFKFYDRNNRVYTPEFVEKLREQVDACADLQLTKAETAFLSQKAPFLDRIYREFLSNFRFDPNQVDIFQEKDGRLGIFATGPLYKVSLWETIILTLVSELSSFSLEGQSEIDNVRSIAVEKMLLMKEHNLQVADFGTRRRHSYEYQYHMLTAMIEKDPQHKSLIGTSNVHFAHVLGLTPIGTTAHEYYQLMAAIYGYLMANTMGMENWVKVYRGSLGIALTDTFTTKNFFENFDLFNAKLWDGLRHDSGDPIVFGEKAIEHYKMLKIDPMSKTLVFSDGLTIKRAIEIKKHFEGRIKISFGIGTHLTNDWIQKALNIVMKLNAVLYNGIWIPTVKLSDVLGKNTGDEKEVTKAKLILGAE